MQAVQSLPCYSIVCPLAKFHCFNFYVCRRIIVHLGGSFFSTMSSQKAEKLIPKSRPWDGAGMRKNAIFQNLFVVYVKFHFLFPFHWMSTHVYEE